ncbi:hypothetical protein ACFLXZ_00470 [Chloroflexota bacterium]
MVEKATLVKFSQYEHICQLRDEGILYMNNLPYFWQIEDEELRGDKLDSIAEIRRGNSGIAVPKNEPDKPVTITSWNSWRYPCQPEKTNIFCMCAVRPSVGSFPIDKKNFRFGDYALILTNSQEFIDRISSQLKAQNISHKANLVEYVSNNYVGEVGLFRKSKKFAYQSEWRLVCFDGPGKERDFRIGDIKDICIIVKSSEVNQRLSVLLTGAST